MVAVDVADSAVFDVLDVFGGATILVKPNATLDGSLPLRAARACSPLLEGNRFGFQVELTQKLTFTKTFTGIKLAALPEALNRAISGSMPRILAEGLFPRASIWASTFAQGIVAKEKGFRHRISLFTGLFVRPRKGYWLRLGNAGNRRNLAFDIDVRWVSDATVFTPLVVTLSFMPDVPFPLELSGEIATLAPFVPNSKWEMLEGQDVEKLGHAHTNFFDAKYFSQKKRSSTKKYRQMVDREPEATLPTRRHAGIATLGPAIIDVETAKSFLTSRGVEPAIPRDDIGTEIEEAAFFNSVPLVCSFDGHHTHVEPDQHALDQFAQETRRVWSNVFGAEYVDQHKGALWYFSKYVTPHQPGEPYFFVKPPALMSTPPGYSSLIEGVPGDGYSVLRGVVATDVFHALPAVIRIDRPLQKIRIPAGTVLATFLPFPRSLLDATFHPVEWAHAPRLRGAL